MIVAGGVYVERCATPETTQLLGSGGRAALALSKVRDGLTLHTFQPPELWPDLIANFAPFGITCQPHAAADRITFSYLFPLGAPVRSPWHVRPSQKQLVEGKELLSFGCVEGRFVIRGDVVVHDPQGSSEGFREAGSTATRLALILNAKELLALTGIESVHSAAAALLKKEQASAVVVKDGPRGAMAFDNEGAESWIAPYHSSSLYKIGSGDVFSAVFAHVWAGGMDAAAAADYASQHTAAYVEAPVLPLNLTHSARTQRSVRMPEKVHLVIRTTSLTDTWFAAVVQEALSGIGIESTEVIDTESWRRGKRPSKTSEPTAALILLRGAKDLDLVSEQLQPGDARQVFFIDEMCAAVPGPSSFTDLSQAIYELCWSR